MKTIKGNKEVEIGKEELLKLSEGFKKVVLDIGTGDGRYVYKNAIENPNTFYIGVDPNAKQLEIYSKTALRKKLANVLFVVGSIEIMPQELESFANKITVNLPWGSLLKEIVKPNPSILKKYLKQDGELEILLGYDRNLEPSETARLEIPELDDELLANTIVPAFQNDGFSLVEKSEISRTSLKKVNTTWGNKLTFGKERKIFRLKFALK